MIEIRDLFDNESKITYSVEFMEKFRNELIINDITIPEDFGLMMIVKAEHMQSLTKIIIDYMTIILGVKIPATKIAGYRDHTDLPTKHAFHVYLNRCGGMLTKGFYYPSDNEVYIEIGKHLRLVLPTMFHEMMHSWINFEGIAIIDDYPIVQSGCFDFESMMHETNQEEGLCELAASLMCYHIFDVDRYPSNVDEYWLGWRLCVQSFISFVNFINKQFTNQSNIWITKMAFSSLFNYIKNTNNLYKFVQYVPKNIYQRTKCIHF